MEKNIKIGFLRDRFHSNILIQQLSQLDQNILPFFIDNILKIRKADIIHVIGCFYSPKEVLMLLLAKILQKKIICHWIGSDVLRIFTERLGIGRIRGEISKKFTNFHLAVSDNLIKELQQFGIYASKLPIVKNLEEYKPSPLSSKFAVLAYIPKNRPYFYGWGIIKKLAREFPEIKFLIVGGKREKRSSKLTNVEFLGWITNTREIYNKSNVLIRITEHDGLPKMVLEALALGRQVICSTKFPYCYYARSYEEVKDLLFKIRRDRRINVEGSNYVKKNYNFIKIGKDLINIYRRIIE